VVALLTSDSSREVAVEEPEPFSPAPAPPR
jgi:hypothetical protein